MNTEVTQVPRWEEWPLDTRIADIPWDSLELVEAIVSLGLSREAEDRLFDLPQVEWSVLRVGDVLELRAGSVE